MLLAVTSTIYMEVVMSETIANGKYSRIGRIGAAVEMTVIAAIAVLVNLFWEQIGFWIFFDEPRNYVPLLSAEFPTYLPLFNISWALTFTLAVWKYTAGYWMSAMRWLELVIAGVSIYVLLQLLFGPPILGIRPDVVVEIVQRTLLEERWLPLLNKLLRFAFAIGLIGTAIDGLVKLWRLISGSSGSSTTAHHATS